jgi:glycosyltransferase involved in cell wall biosynthesis
MKISVIIPSYNRPASLVVCLGALKNQNRLPDEVIVIVRSDDEPTRHAVNEWVHALPLRILITDVPGTVNALNLGLAAASGDIVSVTDDDAAPRPEWFQQIERYFEADPKLGGLGGRDWVHDGSHLLTGVPLVGKIQFFGRLVGNHHIGMGPPREVHFLKGVNMSFRRAAIENIRFDTNLRGRGAQVDLELAFCLNVRRNGWKLIYDPAVGVDHYIAPRLDFNVRGGFRPDTAIDAAFNQYWALATGLPKGMQRTIALAWQVMAGSRALPGFLYLALCLVRGDSHAWQRWKVATRGRNEARKSLAAGKHKYDLRASTEGANRT